MQLLWLPSVFWLILCLCWVGSPHNILGIIKLNLLLIFSFIKNVMTPIWNFLNIHNPFSIVKTLTNKRAQLYKDPHWFTGTVYSHTKYSKIYKTKNQSYTTRIFKTEMICQRFVVWPQSPLHMWNMDEIHWPTNRVCQRNSSSLVSTFPSFSSSFVTQSSTLPALYIKR